jgi:hypothetical protein
MAPRAFLAVLTLTLVATVAVGITACGSGPVTTTTTVGPTLTEASPTTSTTVSAPPTTAAPTTASTATTAGATTADTATQDEYGAIMSAWVLGPLQSLDTSVFDIPDPANATTEQIDAVAAFVGRAGALLDQLKAIKPSAEALGPHNQFVKAYEDLLAATDKFVGAMRSKDASDLPAIEQVMSTAQGQIRQAVSILSPMIGLTSPTA